jgi:tight adherence protein B
VALPLLLLFMFLAASLGVAAGYSIWKDLRHRDSFRARRRMDSEFQKPETKSTPHAPLFKHVSQLDLDEMAPDRLSDPGMPDVPLPHLERTDWRSSLETTLAQSALSLTLLQLGYLSAGAALVGALLGFLLNGFLLALIAFLGLGVAPLCYVRHRQKARRERFLKQLPSAFDLMARVLRSGHSVPQAFQAVADSFEPPIAGEFAFCQEQQNLGLLPDVTYRDLARRTGVLEIKIFVMAMMIQRQAGGNLSEVLERLATLVRERVRLRNHIRTLTAEGRLQALVLLVLPPIMFLVMRFINRPYADILLEHTGLLMGMAVSMGLGALWIRKIIQFDF